VKFLLLCKVFKNVKFSIKLVWPMLQRSEEKKAQFSFFFGGETLVYLKALGC
jgi:hypothetical protein